MRSLIALTLFVALVTLDATLGHIPRPVPVNCVRDIDEQGNPARCGGWAGARCPFTSVSPCRYYPGADYGPCCLSCPFNRPPGRMCTPFTRCSFGRRCVFPLNPGNTFPPRGVCCF